MLTLASNELIIDNFAGGGGASTGITLATGREIDIAINHDKKALAMHRVNHPETLHLCESVWAVDIKAVLADRPVGLAWFSPDCKHFSKAKGGAPVEKKIRGLAWIVLKWASQAKPRIIVLENVEEFKTWGPLITKWVIDKKTGERIQVRVPCKKRKGMTFIQWKEQLESLGYVVEFRELRACDYGAPTTRKRLFVIARNDGMPIIWPEHSHGGGKMPYRTAAECIDWSIPCPSIFDRKKPLKPNTLRRIAKGMDRYIINAAEPFIVNMAHGGKVESIHKPVSTIATEKGGCRAVVIPHLVGVGGRMGQSGPRPVNAPYHTTTAKADTALVSAVLVRTAHGEVDKKGKKRGRGDHSMDQPLPTVTASGDFAVAAVMLDRQFGNSAGGDVDAPLPVVMPDGQGKTALVAAFLAQHNNHRGNIPNTGRDAREPLSTITGRGTQQQVVSSTLIKLRGTSTAQSIQEPLHTITSSGSHFAEVRAFLMKYYGTDQAPQLTEPLGTITTKDRFALVTIKGIDYAIVDIGMRMLSARELFRAQGFPENYIIDHGIIIHHDETGEWIEDVKLTKTDQVRMCGNSVSPQAAQAIVAAQFPALQVQNRMFL